MHGYHGQFLPTKSPATIVWKVKEIKFLIIGKERAKVSLSSSDMIVNLENPKTIYKEIIRINKSISQVVRRNINV